MNSSLLPARSLIDDKLDYSWLSSTLVLLGGLIEDKLVGFVWYWGKRGIMLSPPLTGDHFNPKLSPFHPTTKQVGWGLLPSIFFHLISFIEHKKIAQLK
jgi:hypothetical protein